MIYCKYVFPSMQDFIDLIKSVYTSEPEDYNSFANEEALFTFFPMSLSTDFHIDVIWHKEVNEIFNQYEVFPKPTGLHVIMGMEQLYVERYSENIQSQAPE